MHTLRSSFALPAIFLAMPSLVAFAAPQWIWSSTKAGAGDQVWVRKSFDLPEANKAARLMVSCDNSCEVWVNGEYAGRSTEWEQAAKVHAGNFLKAGRNVIAIKGANSGGIAGLVAQLNPTSKGGKPIVESGADWKITAQDPGADWEKGGFNDTTWTAALVVAKLGDAPWGNVLAVGGGGGGGVIPAESLNVLPGFKAELIYQVPKAQQGSWVSMTVDNKGRLIAGDQEGSLYRVTLGGAEPSVEQLKTQVKQAQGLLWHRGALYLSRNGRESGFYRLRDTNGDDQYDEETLLSKFDGGGEHGPHGVIPSPDGNSLYVIGGNHTKLPNPEKSMLPKLWDEDFIIPRMWDANGHAAGIFGPGGWVAKTDLNGSQWTTITGGFRNSYDIAMSPNGQIFTYDSDMEWDIGTPWYRPTRAYEVAPGVDYGWRSGSGKSPAYYSDTLPGTLDIGPGSPTGVAFGTGAKFPPKYQNALYIADWTYGTMYVLHLKAQGGAWTADKEEFVSGKPLPLTDVVIRPQDGAMYFLIGGRGTQSALYRITYTGSGSTVPAAVPALTAEMKKRMELESLMGNGAPESAVRVWAEIGNADRSVRHAARAALELIPVGGWKEKALAETSPESSINALLALARVGCDTAKRDAFGQLSGGQGTASAKNPPTPEQMVLRDAILKSAARLNFASLTEPQQQALLRLHTVLFSRTGKPEVAACAEIRARFEPHFPAKSADLNRSLCELLVYLDSPQVVSKTMQLLTTAQDDRNEILEDKVLARNDNYAKAVNSAMASRANRQQIAYGWALRMADVGWTPEQRRQFFRWFNTARKFQGGNSLRGFIENIRKDALTRVPQEMRKELEGLSEQLNTVNLADLPRPKGPGAFWGMEEVMALTKDGLKGRNFENGRTTYQAALCSACHRFGGEYGGVGPDITGAANRYSMKDLLENIIEPSKVISDQYESTLVEKKDGSSLVGRVVKEEAGSIFIAENPLMANQLTSILSTEIKGRSKYPISSMPPALLNQLNKDEVLDLLAYLLSGGNKEDKVFK